MAGIKVEITGDVCEHCGQIEFLCDCCAICPFALSLHCENCDECACNDNCA